MTFIQKAEKRVDSEATTESFIRPIKLESLIRLQAVAIVVFVCYLPAKAPKHHSHKRKPGNLRNHRSTKALKVEKPSPENIRHRGCNSGHEGAESARPDREVLGEVDGLVGVVPVKPDEDGYEEVYAFGEEEAEELAEFFFEGFSLCWVGEFGAVGADDFFGWGDEEGEGETQALQGDEDEVGGVANLSLFVAVDVQGELN